VRVIEILRTALNSADGQWVLRAREGAVAELALSKVLSPPLDGADEATSLQGGRARNALLAVADGGTAMNTLETRVVDRSFVDNDMRWIIDYKTADLGAQAGEAELKAHAERFRAQLQAYAILFADESLPQQLAIFYVAHGKLITLAN
jgi:ATP-dependent exoDNAse (exonuclease V) beta subunit